MNPSLRLFLAVALCAAAALVAAGKLGAAVDAHTSGGSISLAEAGGLAELKTSGGSVRVTVDKAAAFRLDASSSGGGVDAGGLTLALEKDGSNRSRLAGSVNGGGPVLKLRSSGGGIMIAVP